MAETGDEAGDESAKMCFGVRVFRAGATEAHSDHCLEIEAQRMA